MKAKDPEAAAKILGKHVQRDGNKVANEVTKFVKSDDVKRNLRKAKEFAVGKLEEAKKGMQSMVKQGTTRAKSAVKSSTTMMSSKAKSKAKPSKASSFKEEKV